MLSGEAILLSDLAPETRNIRSSSVTAIMRKALENNEERGLKTLYLALGKLTWTSDDGGRPPEAPILLVPIEFKGNGQDAKTLSVQLAGRAEVNPVLLFVLKKQFDIEIPMHGVRPHTALDGAESISDDSTFTAEDYKSLTAIFESRCSSLDGFGLTDFAVVGNFSFQKLAMVQDLQTRFDDLLKNDVIAAIAGDPQARKSLGGGHISIDPRSLDEMPPAEEFEVLEADSSQQAAIAGISRGQSAVIHGPPGTGKSQTITNLIATLTAQGKKVLFVAEKRAALEVVAERLKRAGLGHLAIDLHGAELSGKRVMVRVAETLALIREAQHRNNDNLLARFAERRGKLNAHDQRMHAVHEPTMLSVFEMQAVLLRLKQGATTTLRWRGASLSKLTQAACEELDCLLRDAAGFESLFLRTDGSPWLGMSFKDGDSTQAAVDLVNRIDDQLWTEFDRVLAPLLSEAALQTPFTWTEVRNIEQVLSNAHSFLKDYTPEAFRPEVEQIIAGLAKSKSRGLKAFWLKLTSASFRSVVREANALRSGRRASAVILYRDLKAMQRVRSEWEPLGQPSSTPRQVASLFHFKKVFLELSVELSKLAAIRSISGWDEGTMEASKKAVTALAQDSTTPYRLLALDGVENKLIAIGAERLLEELRSKRTPAKLWPAVFRHVLLSSTLDAAAAKDPEIRGFVGLTHSERVREFCELDKLRLEHAKERVRHAHARKAIEAMDAHPEQDALIRQEAAKGRCHRSIRRMFKEAGDTLTAVCPCWMASPLSVAQLIDGASGYFDYVIFDEASQILPEDAIPAIRRAKYVIVAGDNQQLPPTAFFASGDDDDALDEEESEANGYESLLDSFCPLLFS